MKVGLNLQSQKPDLMAQGKNRLTVVEEKIVKRIVLLRDEKVILDVHLAELYG